jgi:hypothetical protein
MIYIVLSIGNLTEVLAFGSKFGCHFNSNKKFQVFGKFTYI